jgi:hypothetical protein
MAKASEQLKPTGANLASVALVVEVVIGAELVSSVIA